jgi:hypothetical protein
MHQFRIETQKDLRGLSPRTNYTDRAIAYCRRKGQLLRVDGVAWSTQRIPTVAFSASSTE